MRTGFDPNELHVELLFQSVAAIKLPISMDGGLVVDMADCPMASAARKDAGIRINSGSPVFTVRSSGFAGHVVADHLFLREEHRTRYSPFSLFQGYLSSDFNR
ncbi:hypothetical protein [Streptosporangium sp. NPDC049644]|uniref:hypothetical protein n=1 Tax=Streptosporangium sp. NPDC049644 TaxID=3155507 RepID=UPI00342E6001